MTALFPPPPGPFSVARLPELTFGENAIESLPELMAGVGSKALIITGRSSFTDSEHWPALKRALAARGVSWEMIRVTGEPSPELVDETVSAHRPVMPDMVVAIGGGSVLDAGKSIAGLLPGGDSVMEYLEGVGAGRSFDSETVPLIAVPTTAGTGSEATKNAVLSRQGPDGFKKSFRSAKLVAARAVIDPALLDQCPPLQIAANGMDAFTQLMESYVATGASPFTDALAWSGLTHFAAGFWTAWEKSGDDAMPGYRHLAYASYLSGVTLAQAGLGSVHGLASPLGGFFPIPHGIVCGTLVAAATEVNIRSLQAREPDNRALGRYAEIGRLLSARHDLDDRAALTVLQQTLNEWTERLDLPRLREYGIAASDFPKLIANARGGSMKTNPIVLTDEELSGLLAVRL